jgi:hypothetical protein
MDDIEVVRGIGLPPHGNSKYPFDKLAVGDGIYFAGPSAKRISATVSQWGTRNGRKFKTRAQADGRVLVVRVE